MLYTHLNSDFVELTGTSMAAPFVTGLVALILKIIDLTNQNLIPLFVYNTRNAVRKFFNKPSR
ncbi:S8 family serine peptidase [Viridibacillus sp. NPDC096237]|uniref:S8 family serine peptidase n=1 Tax=Viridibacillus sp. NPDC096237 TaxID=3390721 RepID=UPI003CFF1FBF